jgi:hypothetical protein
MTQATPIIGAGKSGLTYRQEDNAGKQALLNHHKGPSAPNYAEAGLIWLDDSATPWLFKCFDGTDWITMGQLNAGTNHFTPMVGTSPLGASSLTLTTAGQPHLRVSSSDNTVGLKSQFIFEARNAASTPTTFGRLTAETVAATAGTEEGMLRCETMVGGSLATRLRIGAGVYTNTMTDPGVNNMAAQIFRGNGFSSNEISLAQNTVFSFTPAFSSGFLFVHAANNNATYRAFAYYVAGASALISAINGGTNMSFLTSVLTGTTGPNAFLNISANADGRIYIENRIGSTATFRYSIIS